MPTGNHYPDDDQPTDDVPYYHCSGLDIDYRSDNERPGDYGTAHIIHTLYTAYYFPADVWTVDHLVGSNPDDDGNVHYFVHSWNHVAVDYDEHVITIRPT
jgi:hypothetical protein